MTGHIKIFTSLILVLVLGGCATRSASPPIRKSQGIYHVVKAGENLYRIGKAYDISYKDLARVNQIRDTGQIHIGQKLFIPGARRQLPVEIITPVEPNGAISSIPLPLQPETNGFVWPVDGTINSGFGPRGLNFHDGVDIAAPEGTPIRAIESGQVIFSDKLRGYGNIVIIRHGGGFVSVYAHNQSNRVREGQMVSRGDIIARVGSTGRVSGPHLHLEIRKNNVAQDPLHHLPQVCCLPVSDTALPGG